jgi:hypothetical protein
MMDGTGADGVLIFAGVHDSTFSIVCDPGLNIACTMHIAESYCIQRRECLDF